MVDMQSRNQLRGQPLPGVHDAVDTHYMSDAGPGGLPLARLIDTIRENWRVRQNWVKSQTSLINQMHGYCRRLAALKLGDGATKKAITSEAQKIYRAAHGKGEHEMAAKALFAMTPQLRAYSSLAPDRAAIEKTLIGLAGKLPAVAWVKSMRGFGLLSFAGIVGEAGALHKYRGPAKLWKRMGLAVMPDGQRQRKVKEKEEGTAQGYSPARRSLMWTIGDCIIRAQKKTNGPLYQLYTSRKAKTLASSRGWTKKHAHNDAKRIIEKRLLRDLWRAWRDAMNGVISNDAMHPSNPKTTFTKETHR